MFTPELILIAAAVISSLFFMKRNITKMDINILNVIFAAGVAACVYFFIKRPSVGSVFKIYFLCASVLFLLRHSTRFHVLERVSLLTLLIGIFNLITGSSDIAVFMSLAVILVSVYAFIITRQRPNKNAVTAISILLLFILLYKLSPVVVTVLFLITALCYPFKTTDKSLESFITTIVTPITLFLCLKHLNTSVDKELLIISLRVIGCAAMIAAPVLLFSKLASEKRMAKYGLFYLGNIIFLLSMSSVNVYTLSMIYLFMLALIYDAEVSSFSIFNMSMLPPSPAFIIKLYFLSELVWKSGAGYQIAVTLSSLAVMLHACTDLYKTGVRRPLILKIVPIAAIIVALIYLGELRVFMDELWKRSF
ncbi:MAG: hypothetical protein V1647_06325 [Pseudomonadota bacterium]